MGEAATFFSLRGFVQEQATMEVNEVPTSQPAELGGSKLCYFNTRGGEMKAFFLPKQQNTPQSIHFLVDKELAPAMQWQG